jgi:hypothetical protein
MRDKKVQRDGDLDQNPLRASLEEKRDRVLAKRKKQLEEIKDFGR